MTFKDGFTPRDGFTSGMDSYWRWMNKLITVPFQIKNLVSTAHALATQEGCQVTMSHLEVAFTACEDFECDFKGAGSTEALKGYF
jgi:hypothetical protein